MTKILIENRGHVGNVNIPIKFNDFCTPEQNINVMEITKDMVVIKKISNHIIDEIKSGNSYSPRVIFSTNKQRDLFTKIDIVIMKTLKKVLDFSLMFLSSENFFPTTVKNMAVEKQNKLVKEKFYKKKRGFSKDELYEVAIEIVHELDKQKMDLAVANVQSMLEKGYEKVSYRKAYTVYRFIIDNKLAA